MRSQVAGLTALSVLDVPTFGRSAGLGFDFVAISDNDLCVMLDNPSLITPRVSEQLSLGYVSMFGSYNFITAAYGHSFGRYGSMTFGLRYAGYGTMQGFDEYEQTTGSFTANDILLQVGWGVAMDDHVSFGVNCKPILSQYESYTALALAFDVAGSYVSRDKRFALTLMGRNIGAQLLTFDGTAETLPFHLDLSGSYRLKEAPLCLFFRYGDMQRWQLKYEDPLNPTTTTDAFTGEVTTQSGTERFFDNLGRHLGAGVEITIREVVFLRVGYNYRQSVEMTGVDAINGSGFSFGFGVRVKGFEFSYSRNNYNQWQAPNYLTLSADLSRFFK